MKYLYKGSQSQERLDVLLSFGKSTSEDIKSALSDYLVRGINKTNAATLNGVPGPNLTRALKRLEVVAGKVERVKELDWSSRLC
jgi:selenocysteine lyase/cysteine desulfurase